MTLSTGHVTKKGGAKKPTDTNNATKKSRAKRKTVRHVKPKEK